MYRLLVSDIDGTLVDSRQRLVPGNLRAVQAMVADGVHFTLATGRMEEAVRPFLDALPVTAPLILYNGARIVDHQTLEPLYERHLEAAEVPAYLRAARGLPLTAHLYQDGRSYVASENEASREHARKDGIRLWPVGDLLRLAGRPVTKLLLIADSPEVADAGFEAYQARLDAAGEPRCHVVRSEPTYLEILPQGTTKGAALLCLAEKLGIAPDEVIAVGDGLNDLEMLEAAGLGVAVANAHPKVLARADYVSVSCDEAAIEDIARRFLTKAG